MRDSLIARLDRLAPVREVAQIGACIGREFSYELLAAVSPLKGVNARGRPGAARPAAGLLFRRGTPPDATYTFKHALVQDAAYDSLLKSKRAQLHAQIAQSAGDATSPIGWPTNRSCSPITSRRPGCTQRAVPYWILAGQRALARVALAEAVAHLTTALSVNEQLPASVERDRASWISALLLGAAYLASRAGRPSRSSRRWDLRGSWRFGWARTTSW